MHRFRPQFRNGGTRTSDRFDSRLRWGQWLMLAPWHDMFDDAVRVNQKALDQRRHLPGELGPTCVGPPANWLG